MTTVSITPEKLPDAELTLLNGLYTFKITGLSEMVENPRRVSPEESRVGILSAVPPTVQTREQRDLALLMVRAVEIAMPAGLLTMLETVEGPAYMKHHFLIAQITRVLSLLLMRLELS